ncbi:MAG: imidazole glycerol phosphate synthase subunit HisH [Thermodesulfobacteriota bacterium]|nr:imidazole glycerol phosphate synthase subunit HisH [Thermodesulfobacteriota bacterium]MEE2975774.1 imidazole glycerol phosphate synthase subunit HisH [Thermodesulfobacteriota bacterium]
MIAIIDYGFGNLQSVKKALSLLNYESVITSSPEVINSANSIIFPGVGAFGDCIANLHEKNLFETLKNCIKGGKPFLGICLGLQILFEGSDESPQAEGLSIFKGNIDRINFNQNKLKVPHMGWNQIEITKNSNIFQGVENLSWLYFVHSYKLNIGIDIADSVSNYGDKFVSSISFENIYATQFHPEKSSTVGLQILDNFSKISS